MTQPAVCSGTIRGRTSPLLAESGPVVPVPLLTLPSNSVETSGPHLGWTGCRQKGLTSASGPLGGPAPLTVYRSPLFFRALRCPELGFPQPLYLFSPFLPQGPEAPPGIPKGAPCTRPTGSVAALTGKEQGPSLRTQLWATCPRAPQKPEAGAPAACMGSIWTTRVHVSPPPTPDLHPPGL